MHKRRLEDFKSRGDECPQGNHVFQTHTNLQTLAAHKGLAQVQARCGPRAARQMWGCGRVLPLLTTFSVTDSAYGGQIRFLQWSLTHLRVGPMPSSSCSTQTQWYFCLMLLCLDDFYFIVLLLVYFVFHSCVCIFFFLRKRERKGTELGG